MRRARSHETSPHTGLSRARLALALTALVVSVPTPLSRLWGIGEGPNGLFTLLAVLLWIASIAMPSIIRKGADLRFDAWWPLILDVFFLTCVLGLNSAAENPFTLLYFVPITLATLVSQVQTFRVALAAVLGFGLLFSISAEGVDLSSPRGHFMRHVLGMAIGLAVSGALLTVFFHRIAHELSEQRRRISELSEEQARDRMVTTIGAMAAGAAHELGTPLGTIQLLADDLHLMDREVLLEAQATIAEETQRMKRVLSEMDTVELRGELLNIRAWDGRELIDEARAYGAHFECTEKVLLQQPERVVRQIVRELLNNAERASSPHQKGLMLSVRSGDQAVEVAVLDRGPGFSESALESALTPFWSTSGRRGLGLFLASTHARTLGGSLTISEREGGGAHVVLSLPSVAPFARHQG